VHSINDILEKHNQGFKQMEHRSMKHLFLVLMIIFVAACNGVSEEMGTLEGRVTIGPMLPAMREGLTEPTPAPEAYAQRQIVIYAENGQREISRVQIDHDGNYQVTLPAGTYVVDINHAGVDQGLDLPRTVEIVSGQVTNLDVTIDTGVR
jgi:hypothetical protein